MPMVYGNVKFYTTQEIAEILNVTDVSIRNYIKNGYLKGQKFLGRWMFAEKDIMDFLKSLQ